MTFDIVCGYFAKKPSGDSSTFGTAFWVSYTGGRLVTQINPLLFILLHVHSSTDLIICNRKHRHVFHNGNNKQRTNTYIYPKIILKYNFAAYPGMFLIFYLLKGPGMLKFLEYQKIPPPSELDEISSSSNFKLSFCCGAHFSRTF